MNVLLIVNNPKHWPLDIGGVRIVSARDYLTDPSFSEERNLKVFNLCRSYRYQTAGYYVSLLAAARGHRPMPDINTIQDLKSQTVIKTLSEDLDEKIQHALKHITSNHFTLSIYFGRNMAKRYDSLSLHLFNIFQAPLLRAEFIMAEEWELKSISTIAINDIPESHHDFLVEAATNYFAGRKRRIRRRIEPLFDLAVLVNPEEKEPPSDALALNRFQKAAEKVGMGFELIGRDDFHRIPEFDALFIRETTAVNHHTFRFAQKAAAEGLVVIDDPESILKCSNKVYLSELLTRHGVPTPKTVIVHKHNFRSITEYLELPCILKQPDSAFSRGVSKVETREDLEDTVIQLLKRSDLILAQEFLPTTFDWRIGIIDQRPLYVCRYHMASEHWQVIHRDEQGNYREGESDTLSISEAPDDVIRTALKAANLIGNGLYGVDLKQVGNKCYIIEVNDNPDVFAGVEDLILKDALYREIMGVFLKRVKQRMLQYVQ
jgi:glutathione synthase/RimK-type ligase-like ATP-grasp enzyme